jgi:hypothetical protein
VNIVKAIIRSDGGVNFLMTNYSLMKVFKVALRKLHADPYFPQSETKEKQEKFFNTVFGTEDFGGLSLSDIRPFSASLVYLIEKLKDYMNLVNRFFNSLSWQDSDQALIRCLVQLRQDIHSSVVHTYVFGYHNRSSIL